MTVHDHHKNDQSGSTCRGKCTKTYECQADKARNRNIVQNAEEDPFLGCCDECGKADGGGRTCDDGETFPEGPPPNGGAVCEHQAHAGQEEEGARNCTRIELPSTLRRCTGFEIAKEAEIPGEMIGCHRDQCDAAQAVDQRDAGKGRRRVYCKRQGVLTCWSYRGSM